MNTNHAIQLGGCALAVVLLYWAVCRQGIPGKYTLFGIAAIAVVATVIGQQG